MDHSYFHSRLSALADGELPADERAQVEEHVKQCQDCRQRLDQLRQLEELTERESGLADSDYWEAAAQRIEANLDAPATPATDITQPRAKAKSSFWWKLPAIAASILVVGYVGLHESDILKDEVMIPPSDQSPTESRDLDEPGADSSRRAAVKPEKSDAEEYLVLGHDEAESEETDLSEVISSPLMDEEAVAAEHEDIYRPKIVTEERTDRPTPEPESESRQSISTPAKIAAPRLTVESESTPVRSRTKAQVSASSAREGEVVDRYNSPAKKVDDNLEKKEPVVTKPEFVPSPPPPPPAAPAQSNYQADRVTPDNIHDTASQAALDGVFVLDDLRHQRDSLVGLIAELEADPGDSKRLKRLKGAVREFVANSGDNRGRRAQAVVDRTTLLQARFDLVEVWCQICQTSEDEAEFSEGVEFLRSVEDGRLSARKEAAACLEVMERQ